MGAALALRPSRGRSARSASVVPKPKRNEAEEATEGGGGNRAKMLQWKISKVAGCRGGAVGQTVLNHVAAGSKSASIQ